MESIDIGFAQFIHSSGDGCNSETHIWFCVDRLYLSCGDIKNKADVIHPK